MSSCGATNAKAANGPIPSKMQVLHRCDVMRCCNPAHLFLGTHQDNMRDKMAKGRQARGSRSGSSKLGERDVGIIKTLLDLGVRHLKLAALFGVSKAAISSISRGRTWRHVEAAS